LFWISLDAYDILIIQTKLKLSKLNLCKMQMVIYEFNQKFIFKRKRHITCTNIWRFNQKFVQNKTILLL